MQYVLVSACLLGHPVRYDGRSVPGDHNVLAGWLDAGRVVPVCPEVAGGLPVPRPPAEIKPGADAVAVLAGRARVMTVSGEDATRPFVAGAQQALDVARRRAIRIAVLKEGSPSCGSGYVYDGSFSGQRQPGVGVTAHLLAEAGVRVFSEHQWAEAAACLARLEAEYGI